MKKTKTLNKVTCKDCGQKFASRGLGVHRSRAHPAEFAEELAGGNGHILPVAETNELECKDCHETFDTGYALTKHRQAQHPSKRWLSARAAEKAKMDGESAPKKSARQIAPVDYCPRCGCNIHAVAVALSL